MWQSISIKVRNKTSVLSFLPLVQYSAKVYIIEIRQEKETRKVPTGNERKLSLFVDSMILCRKDQIASPGKFSDPVNTFRKV